MSVKNELTDYLYKYRGYPHFDREISQKSAQIYVQNPRNIESHPFYPFLKQVQTTPRYNPKEHKTKNKKRPILYASHTDSHIYAWYGQILNFHYEQLIKDSPIGECILAYRTLGKSNIHFAKEVFDQIEERDNCTALALDLSSFFDTIDHNNLKSAWCEVLGEQQLPL